MVQAIIRDKNRIGTILFSILLAAPLAAGAQEEPIPPVDPVPTVGQTANEALFREGMEALEDQRLKSAIRAFSTILDDEPELHRAKLELALAYYRSMRYEKAERLASQVLDDPATPPEVRVTILAFLAQVRRDAEEYGEKHNFTPFIAAGIMHDTNVNVGPSVAGVRVGDTTLTLAPDSLSQSDNAYIGNAGFDHLYQSGKRVEVGEQSAALLWQSGASVYWRRYHEQNDYDMMVASINTGPAILMLRKWRASLQLRSDYLTLAGHALSWINSVEPAVTWQFNNGELTLEGNYSYRSYHRNEDEGREGDYGYLGVTLSRYLDNRRFALTAGARAVGFNADADQFAYTGGQINAGISGIPWPNGTAYARGRYSDFYYQGDTPSFNKERHDQEYLATLGLTHTFRNDDDLLKNWVVNAFWERTFNDSNISGFYTYTRYQTMLMLSRSF